MSHHSRQHLLRGVIGGALLALIAAPLAVIGSAQATPDGDNVVINEVYLNGGSANATYLNKYVELYNPTDAEISLDGWSVQYRPYNGVAAFTTVVALTGHIEPGGTYLVSGNSNGANGAPLPTPDVTSTVSLSGNTNGGTIALAEQSGALTGTSAEVLADPELVDLLGYGVVGGEAPDGARHPSEARRVAFLAVVEQDLQPDADPEERHAGADARGERRDEPLLLERRDRGGGRAHPRQDDALRRRDRRGRVDQSARNAEVLQRILDTRRVSGPVVDHVDHARPRVPAGRGPTS
jgi:hypothetical protein